MHHRLSGDRVRTRACRTNLTQSRLQCQVTRRASQGSNHDWLHLQSSANCKLPIAETIVVDKEWCPGAADAGLFGGLITCNYNYLQDFVGCRITAKYGYDGPFTGERTRVRPKWPSPGEPVLPDRHGWQCHFMEADLQTPLRRSNLHQRPRGAARALGHHWPLFPCPCKRYITSQIWCREST